MLPNMNKLNVNVILDSTALERLKHTKFLGMLINYCHTLENHIDYVFSKTIFLNTGAMNKLLIL